MKKYCDTSLFFLTPTCFIHKVDKVHYEKDEMGGKVLDFEKKMMAIEEQKLEAKQAEYKLLSRLNCNVSGAYLKENAQKTAGYMEIEQMNSTSEKKVKMEEDDKYW